MAEPLIDYNYLRRWAYVTRASECCDFQSQHEIFQSQHEIFQSQHEISTIKQENSTIKQENSTFKQKTKALEILLKAKANGPKYLSDS
jgi:hypothetical protein